MWTIGYEPARSCPSLGQNLSKLPKPSRATSHLVEIADGPVTVRNAQSRHSKNKVALLACESGGFGLEPIGAAVFQVFSITNSPVSFLLSKSSAHETFPHLRPP